MTGHRSSDPIGRSNRRPGRLAQGCNDEATRAYHWSFEHDFVTAMVRADLSLMLQQLQQLAQSPPPVSAPLYCGEPLHLLPFGELCNGTECGGVAYYPLGSGSQRRDPEQHWNALGSNDFPASWAVDGDTNPPNGGQVTLTNVEKNRWWQGDIGFALPIGQVEIWPSQLSLSQCRWHTICRQIPRGTLERTRRHRERVGLTVNNVSEQTFPIILNFDGYAARYIRIQGEGTGALSLDRSRGVPSCRTIDNGVRIGGCLAGAEWRNGEPKHDVYRRSALVVGDCGSGRIGLRSCHKH